MNVLVVNCGSASVKLRVVDDAGRTLAEGDADRVGGDATLSLAIAEAPPRREPAPGANHDAVVRTLLGWLEASGTRVDAVGHRIVHGGARFTDAVVLDDGVVAELEALGDLAPLHNTAGVAGIRAARAALGPRVPMVASFDTAFHATLPERAWRYAIPRALADRHGARRYGFHGLSCRAALDRYAALTRVPAERATLLVLHLGSGCSATAIRDGRSVDTSMGFTPLEGLVMGTRSGDLDPALPGFLARQEGTSVDEIEDLLNRRSGLLGLSGRSSDLRDLLAHEGDDEAARLAIDVFCYRVRKYVGAYLAALGDAQAVVFTGRIGERSAEIRRRVCADMEWCGLTLDAARNAAAIDVDARISADGARIAAWVIPTDEARVIADDVRACVAAAAEGAGRPVALDAPIALPPAAHPLPPRETGA